MKRCFAALALLLLVPALALGEITVRGETTGDGANRIVHFAPAAVGWAEIEGETVLTEDAAPALSEAEQLTQETLMLQITGTLDMRFAQSRAAQLLENAQAAGDSRTVIHQTPYGYADDRLASLAILWEGTQPDGAQGCRPYSLTLDLTTGQELTLPDLFDDADGAVAAMEAIIERDVLEDMNTYVEVYDLLPLPTDCFCVDETGLTVFYTDERFRTFEGRSGYVTFYWYELADYIGEGSAVYALSRAQEPDADAIRAADGAFAENRALRLGALLGDAMDACALTGEPDYTRDAILYTALDADMRGYAVEIPKYAETAKADTPISAVRASRISWHGLTTGKTDRAGVVSLLGEPEKTAVYDEDDAADMLLTPGESLIYTMTGYVLEAHLDEGGVLSCLILHDALPERLY